MGRILTITSFILFVKVSIAQTIIQLPNNLYNQNIYNPGAVGTSESDISVGLISRFQFVTLNGAPRLYEAWGDHKFKKIQSAIGLNVKRETAGATELNDVSLTYAYKLFLSKKMYLNMGLRLGYLFGHFNQANLQNVFDADDPLLNDANRIGTPKIGFGFKLYSDKYFVSLALPDVYAPSYNYMVKASDSAQSNVSESFFKHPRNYILSASYKLSLGDLYYLQPSVLAQYLPYYGTKIEPVINFGLNNYFWFGTGYSNIGYLYFNAGAQISPKMKFAYIYEHPFAKLSGKNKSQLANFSSHSINLLISLDGFLKK